MKMLTTLLLLASLTAQAATPVSVPEDFALSAEVVNGERWGWWEKSLIVTLPEPIRVLSSNEGFVQALAVVNHAAHPLLWVKAFEELGSEASSGGDVYLSEVEERLSTARAVTQAQLALTATAADMDNLAVATERSGPFVVTALVTAGARSNAHRAGTDMGTNIEAAGTVNVILLLNAQLTDGAQTNAVIMATEAKTAAFQDLSVPSSYTPSVLATGTGTDTVIVVPSSTGPEVTYAGGHAVIGGLIARATHRAVKQALIKQNGFSE